MTLYNVYYSGLYRGSVVADTIQAGRRKVQTIIHLEPGNLNYKYTSPKYPTPGCTCEDCIKARAKWQD